MRLRTLIGIFAVLLAAGNAAGLSPADKCESSKLKEAGKYGFCRLKAEAKAVKTASTPDYSKCDAKYGTKWPAIESGGGMCPSNGDQAAIQAFITQHSDDLATALDGGPLPDCPGDLGTCNASLAACLAAPQGQRLKTGQTTCYDTAGSVIPCAGTGQDGELQKGLARSCVDNGDGTVTDTRTGPMWEKQSDDGSIHDKDNAYTWANAFATKVTTLNSTSFAGHNDWRLPNRNELESLVNLGATNPSVDAAFNSACLASCTVTTCSCTRSNGYWSSTSIAANPNNAWIVDYNNGNVNNDNKTNGYYVRAVRGGS